jgi:glycosyltransferase involved in cell wall biosynthesis
MTYNQENYVERAIKSILDQKVDFDFEVVFNDDVSTDGTRRIIERYKDSFPGQMNILSHENNVGVVKNLKRGLEQCQGEYIAILEGDDYWLSTNKLQLQVDFLDSHPECSMCFNAMRVLEEETQQFRSMPALEKKFYTTEDEITRHVASNFSTCMYRNHVVKKIPSAIYDIFSVDWMFNICCSEQGFLGCIPVEMTAYRVHSGGVWSSKQPKVVLEELMVLIPQYDHILGYRYTDSFQAVLKGVKDQYHSSQQAGIVHWLRSFCKKCLPKTFRRIVKLSNVSNRQ